MSRMWDMNQGDYDYCLSIVSGFAYCMVFLGICRVLSWACDRLDDDNTDNNYDHGTSNDHVVIIIKELAGLDPLVLGSIPVVDFNSKDFREDVECVVCLSELVDGEKARALPGCNHWFHADCIDTWFELHSTCPICRNEVGAVQLGMGPEFGGQEEGLTTDDVVGTQSTNSGDATSSSCDEHRVYMTSVVVDISTCPGIGKS